MRHFASFQPYYTRRSGSTFGKVVATIASAITIATILFVGSRDWKTGKSITASLVDISDIRSLFSKVEDAGSSTAQKNAGIGNARNEVERALIEKGTLVRRSSQLNAQEAPIGLTRQAANH